MCALDKERVLKTDQIHAGFPHDHCKPGTPSYKECIRCEVYSCKISRVSRLYVDAGRGRFLAANALALSAFFSSRACLLASCPSRSLRVFCQVISSVKYYLHGKKTHPTAMSSSAPSAVSAVQSIGST